MRQLFILFTLSLLVIAAKGQSSFVRRLNPIDSIPTLINYLPGELAIGSDNSISILGYNSVFPFVLLLGLSPDGNITEHLGIRIVGNTGGWIPIVDYDREGAEVHAFLARSRPDINNPAGVLFFLNREQNTYWARQTATNTGAAIRGAVSCLRNGDILTSHNYEVGAPQPMRRLGLARLTPAGQPIWNAAYALNEPDFFWDGFNCHQTQELEDNTLSIIGTANDDKVSFLLRLNPAGEVLHSLGIANDSIRFLSHSVDNELNTYIAGQKKNSEGYFDGFILKLDANFRIVWSKKLIAEHFNCLRLAIENLPNGNLAFSYATFGDFPIIVGSISPQGELLQYQGYGLPSGLIKVGLDNAFYLLTGSGIYNPNTLFRPLLVKTDPQGNIDGCPQFAACVRLEDFELPLSPWSWTRHPIPPLPELELEISEIPFEGLPYCDTPIPPSAYFTMPDTLCQGSCAAPSELQNEKAHQIEWRITGPGTDTLIVDTTFQWCFVQPGRYEITQEVWVLGCSEAHTEYLEVLSDDLAAPLGPDRVICTQSPYELIPLSSRPLRQWLWDDGSTQATRSISVAGTYHLTASDGYCELADSVRLDFIADLVSPPLFTNLQDTTVCRSFLPLRLSPESRYTQQFTLNGSMRQDVTFALHTAGDYRFGAMVSGCLLEQTIRLTIDPCLAPIYLPNAFSPNDDGINDYYQPQGLNYEGIELSVYDRWGGLLHQTRTAPFRWDGRSEQTPLLAGSYLVVFTYRNLRTGEEERLTQQVFLTR